MVEVQSEEPALGRHPGLVGRTGVNPGDEAGSCLPRGWHLWTVLYALLPPGPYETAAAPSHRRGKCKGTRLVAGAPSVAGCVPCTANAAACQQSPLEQGGGPRLEWGASWEGCCGEEVLIVLRESGFCWSLSPTGRPFYYPDSFLGTGPRCTLPVFHSHVI